MEIENIETRVESKDPLVERILEGLSEVRKVWGENISLYLAMKLHKDPVNGYDPKKERPEKLAIRDKSGKEIPILPLYQ